MNQKAFERLQIIGITDVVSKMPPIMYIYCWQINHTDSTVIAVNYFDMQTKQTINRACLTEI